tara:strand:+ start:12795 stop:14078 length:1284 start_codon:yes stop_codon:yes gene_type:complete
MKNLKKFIHILIWSIFFLKGLIENLDFYPRQLNLLALLLIALLFSEILVKRKTHRPPFLKGVLLLILVCIISAIVVNSLGYIEVFYFFRILILPHYLYLIVIINEKNDSIVQLVIKLILMFFLLQIPASFVKYLLVGNTEMYIGTVSLKEGSVTTLVALFGACYSISKYLYKKNSKYILLFFLFVIFSQIGGKRGVLVYLPIIIGAMYFYFISINRTRMINVIKKSFSITFLTIVVLYSIVRLNPSFNKESKLGGSFDISYALDFIDYYNDNNDDLRDMSRPQALIYMFVYFTNQDLVTILFGEGAGKLTYASSELFVEDTKSPIEHYYGIRYGGRMGIVWIGAQIGLVGSLIFLTILYKMLRYVLRQRVDDFHKMVFLGLWLTVILDIFTYSMVSLNYFIFAGILFTYFGVFVRDQKMGRKLLTSK